MRNVLQIGVAVGVAALLALAPNAHGGTITVDFLDAYDDDNPIWRGFSFVPDGHGGLNWEGYRAIYEVTPTVYNMLLEHDAAVFVNDLLTEHQALGFLWRNEDSYTFTAPEPDEPFYFEGFDASGLYSEANGRELYLQGHVTGYLGGELVGQDLITLSYGPPAAQSFNWGPVDEVVISDLSNHYVDTHDSFSGGEQFVMTELRYTPVSAVGGDVIPEPATALLLGVGAIGIVARRMRMGRNA